MPKHNLDIVDLMESLVKLANNKDFIKAINKISEIVDQASELEKKMQVMLSKVSDVEKKVHQVLKAVDIITSKMDSPQKPQQKPEYRKRGEINLDKDDLRKIEEIGEHFKEDQKILSRILKRAKKVKDGAKGFFKKEYKSPSRI